MFQALTETNAGLAESQLSCIAVLAQEKVTFPFWENSKVSPCSLWDLLKTILNVQSFPLENNAIIHEILEKTLKCLSLCWSQGREDVSSYILQRKWPLNWGLKGWMDFNNREGCKLSGYCLPGFMFQNLRLFFNYLRKLAWVPISRTICQGLDLPCPPKVSSVWEVTRSWERILNRRLTHWWI